MMVGIVFYYTETVGCRKRGAFLTTKRAEFHLLLGDCMVRMAEMPESSIVAVVCDPPYYLTAVSRGGSPRTAGTGPFGRHTVDTVDHKANRGFMGMVWDGDQLALNPELWHQVHRVLRPGGVAKIFGGTRTFHRMAVAIETAGFVIEDLHGWGYSTGFPKSLNVARAIDKMRGAERGKKRIPYTGNAVLRAGGQNTRPWMEEALAKGYHELPDDTPVTDEAKDWDGYGTALKPSWEPVLIARKPRREP